MSRAGRGLRGVLEAAGDSLSRLPRGAALGVVAGWLGLISWLSSWPAQGVTTQWSRGLTLNLGHAFLFGLLALWCALCLPRTAARGLHGASGSASSSAWPSLSVPVRVGLVLLVALFGLLDETHQHLGGRGRDFSLFDVLTDATGAWCTLAIAAYLWRGGGSEGGLVVRLSGAAAACLVAAAFATWGPELWPGLGWL